MNTLNVNFDYTIIAERSIIGNIIPVILNEIMNNSMIEKVEVNGKEFIKRYAEDNKVYSVNSSYINDTFYKPCESNITMLEGIEIISGDPYSLGVKYYYDFWKDRKSNEFRTLYFQKYDFSLPLIIPGDISKDLEIEVVDLNKGILNVHMRLPNKVYISV